MYIVHIFNYIYIIYIYVAIFIIITAKIRTTRPCRAPPPWTAGGQRCGSSAVSGCDCALGQRWKMLEDTSHTLGRPSLDIIGTSLKFEGCPTVDFNNL